MDKYKPPWLNWHTQPPAEPGQYVVWTDSGIDGYDWSEAGWFPSSDDVLAYLPTPITAPVPVETPLEQLLRWLDSNPGDPMVDAGAAAAIRELQAAVSRDLLGELSIANMELESLRAAASRGRQAVPPTPELDKILAHRSYTLHPARAELAALKQAAGGEP